MTAIPMTTVTSSLTVQRGPLYSITDGRVVVDLFLPPRCRTGDLSAFSRLITSSATPGITWPSGIQIRKPLVSTYTLLDHVEFISHEAAHWWDANHRMGPRDYIATYVWHIPVTLGKNGRPSHIHADHMMERFARNFGRQVRENIVWKLRQSAWVEYDLTPLLQAYAPALR